MKSISDMRKNIENNSWVVYPHIAILINNCSISSHHSAKINFFIYVYVDKIDSQLSLICFLRLNSFQKGSVIC